MNIRNLVQSAPFNNFIIAVILVKRGVDAFCGCAPLGAQQAD